MVVHLFSCMGSYSTEEEEFRRRRREREDGGRTKKKMGGSSAAVEQPQLLLPWTPRNGNNVNVVAVGICDKTSCGRAMRWAVQNLKSADRFVLVHVSPPITFIPTPVGNKIHISKMPEDVVAMYIQDVKSRTSEIFIPFQKEYNVLQMEAVILDDDNPSRALLRYISESGVKSLVMGTSSTSRLAKRFRGPDLTSTIMKLAPQTCDIYVVSRYKVTQKLGQSAVEGKSAKIEYYIKPSDKMMNQAAGGREHSGLYKKLVKLYISVTGPKQKKSSGTVLPEVIDDRNFSSYPEDDDDDSPRLSDAKEQQYLPKSVDDTFEEAVKSFKDFGAAKDPDSTFHDYDDFSISKAPSKQSANKVNFEETHKATLSSPCPTPMAPENLPAQAEVERLKQELQNTLSMYNKACQDLVLARKKVQSLSLECVEESKKVKDAQDREEIARKVVEDEKAKHVQALKEVETATKLLAKEADARQKAEYLAMREAAQTKKLADALFSTDQRYRRYTKKELEAATDSFSVEKKIGEGGYGTVYKCNLDHTPVAVKVLRQDATHKKQEFLREVEVLSQIRHPHMVLLLGACPDNGCLVYEYLANGSLEDRLFCKGGTPPLPWTMRFRILYEVAVALTFLHSSKPEPIVHRDLKPGNILLDINFVSKIGDVGLAQLMSNVVPDCVTEYRETLLAGTLYYMDPEYQRTGTVRPKSDLYGFGIIMLQVLTGKAPLGIVKVVETAVNGGTFEELLDKAIKDWPVKAAEELAVLALQCTRLRCRERPELELEVIPQLEKLKNMGESQRVKELHGNFNIPSPFLCPIRQLVMEEPYIAADGFIYEYRAIKEWLENYDVSPMTKLKLSHKDLTPNHSLKSAIQEWKQRVRSLPLTNEGSSFR